MNRIVTTIFLTIALCTFLALGQQESKAATDSKGKANQPEQTLRQIENDTVNALVKGDTNALNHIWADEYSFTAPNGLVVSKENYLAMLQSGSVKYDSLKLEGLQVRIYGDTAVVSGNFVVKGRVGNHELNGTDRLLTVYVKRQGHWQQVASQAARVDRKPMQ